MRITIEKTTRITEINGVPARLWESTTESGEVAEIPESYRPRCISVPQPGNGREVLALRSAARCGPDG